MGGLEFEGFGVIEDKDMRPTELDFSDFGSVPLALTDPDVWANYTDQRIYDLDRAVRAYLASMQYRQKKDGGFKTAAPLVFMYIFGRKPGSSDAATSRLLNKLLEWYCTEVRSNTTIAGKNYRKVYCFSKCAGINKRPYSIRLRIELDYGDHAFDRRIDDNLDKSPAARAERGCKNAGMSYDLTKRRTYGN